MILRMYSLHDNKWSYAYPIPYMTDELAKRGFAIKVKGDPEMDNNREDFSLYYMGNFDTESGTIINEGKEPKLIMKAVEIV